ncbi:hypothetical protein C1645_770133 [Glomus cerebriforme]|uniref:Uncharacterized protein n=1 Tax=Glomus cerebriforme TaxID=658196 RepID=A0A397SWD1_9GLOM|nr:hypothetical protein C1645_770133 [Glomus cerebriforme]
MHMIYCIRILEKNNVFFFLTNYRIFLVISKKISYFFIKRVSVYGSFFLKHSVVKIRFWKK